MHAAVRLAVTCSALARYVGHVNDAIIWVIRRSVGAGLAALTGPSSPGWILGICQFGHKILVRIGEVLRCFD
jgi:hypothetical protein